MLVFIDESGDPGFKLNCGSSHFFIMSMVIFDSKDAALTADKAITELRNSLGIKSEFKFAKCKNEYRDAFFQKVVNFDFSIRAIVVQKERIYSKNLKSNKDSFYKFFVRQMIENHGGALQNAKVVVDGSGNREFKRQFKSYIKRNVETNVVKDCSLKDSKKDSLIQFADMVAGCIARSYNKDRRDCDKWLNILAKHNKIDNIWEFK